MHPLSRNPNQRIPRHLTGFEKIKANLADIRRIKITQNYLWMRVRILNGITHFAIFYKIILGPLFASLATHKENDDEQNAQNTDHQKDSKECFHDFFLRIN